MMEDAKEMLEIAGVSNVKSFESDYAVGMGIHEMGTARMGSDPKTSVLNEWNQVWDALNVYVTDGACMTSSACVNPSLTYMALTARSVDHAVNELKNKIFNDFKNKGMTTSKNIFSTSRRKFIRNSTITAAGF